MSDELGISIADAFKQQSGQPPVKPVVEPPPKPSQLGIPISAAFKPPSAKAGKIQGLLAEVKAGGAAALSKLGELAKYEKGALNPAKDQMIRAYTKSAVDQLKHDFSKPAQEGDTLQGAKVAMDVLNTIWAPLQASIDENISNPMKGNIQNIANAVAHYSQPSAEQKRLANVTDAPPPKTDVVADIESFEKLVDPAMAALEMVVPGPKALGAERDAAGLRTASAALKEATEPSQLKPVTISLDKTMGFKGVTENVAPTWLTKYNASQVAGYKTTSHAVLDEMIPHAQGYARKFLETLKQNVDPKVTVTFKQVAGLNPERYGVYQPSLHKVEIKGDSPDIVHTVSHELYHATTVNVIDSLLDADLTAAQTAKGSKLTADEITKLSYNPKSPLLKELDSIIKETRVRWQKAGLGKELWQKVGYGIQPEEPRGTPNYAKLKDWEKAWQGQIPRYEFLAEMFTNPHLQEFMANSEKYASKGYKFKNMLQQFGHMIGKHLGLNRPHDLQLLNQALSVGSRLMRLQTEKGGATGRDFHDIVVAHLENGGTITKGEMEAATGLSPVEVGKKGARQTAAEAKNALQLSIEGILRTVNPEALGKNAKLAASVVASRITEQMQHTAAWRYGAKTRLRFWRARPDLSKEFIDKFESGATFKDPQLTRLAQKYRNWNSQIAAREGELGFKYDPRENYLYHLFTDSEGVANYFERKYGSKWGDPKFIKERAFNMYKEAIAAGFTPVYDNPEDIMLARQQASDLAEMHIGILNDLASYGLATRKIEGGTKLIKKLDSEGKVTLDFEETKGNKRPDNTTRYRAPNGDVFWVDNQAAVVLDNTFKSKSLWADKTALGVGFRSMMTAKNYIVPVRLALSLFHPLHIVGIDIASTMTRQLSGMLAGQVNPLVGMAKILKAGFDPFYSNPKVGWRVMKAMRGQLTKEELNASDTEALQHLVDGGLILDMSPQYRTNARQNFANALLDAHADFRLRKPGALAGDVARATWHAPWALLSAVQKPLFEDWIPMLKGASYLQDVQMLLERNPDLVEDRASRQLALRKLAKSAENRYGEMAYNTMFWKRWAKDTAVLSTLSLGWQMGFLREYGGGAMDLGQFVKSSDKLQRVREGLLDRPLFVASYTALGAAMGGLMTYGFTGKPPGELLDYIDPQVGGQNPDGTPKRVSTMFYSREFAGLYKHMQDQGPVKGLAKLATNKGSGLFGLMYEWYSGVDSFGEEFRDPNSDIFKKTEETLAYTLANMEPISVSSIRQQAETSTGKDKALAALGFTPAPKYITETKSEMMISQAYDKYVAPKETPFDRAEYSKEFRKLQKQYLAGDPGYGDTLDGMVDKYELSNKDIRRVIKTLNMEIPPSVKMFIQIPWQQQKEILDKMSPEERDQYLPHANKEHVRNSYEAPE